MINYHIRQISTGKYYADDKKTGPWDNNIENAEIYDTKSDAKEERRDYLDHYQLRRDENKNIIIEKRR
ncbi:MAG: hypothetical protein AABW91_04010 [Nanoarchaeota archaeon]